MSADAVLFDMDGVLVDSTAHKRERRRRFVEEDLGLAVDAAELDGLSPAERHARLSDHPDSEFDLDEAAFVRRQREAVNDPDIYHERVSLLEGFEDLATRLADRGVATGLVSASTAYRVGLVVERFDLHEPFDVVLSSETVPGPSKPAPDLYEHAAAILGVDPERCLAVEDSEEGATAARRAGMTCIGYSPPTNVRDPGSVPDTVVSTPNDLRAAVLAAVDGEVDWADR